MSRFSQVRFCSLVTLLYSHVPYHNDTIIKTHAGITDAMIKTQKDFFNKIFTSRFIARVRKGCVGFYCERELETEHNWNVLTPKLWPSALCNSRSPWLLNRSPGVHSAGCWLSLLQLVYLRLQLYSTVFYCPSDSTVLFCSIRRPYITFKLPRGDMDTLPRLCNFFRYLALGMCHFRYIWNGLCDRHRAQITVMQSRGHSLPVRQSMRV